ncbi:MAG: type II toxin-antitoxin system VapC family toxin [Deltaproteobacteria bacterium]|nr:type II toxin-antitoxin system VapC family toxin [Deltaproteobacteria bacterium]
MKNYLFDAFPLLCWLQEEPGYELVDNLLTEAETGISSISMHIINLGEVFYRLCRVTSLKRGEEILEKIRLLPIRILSISDEEVMAAAKIKAQYPISYADAFAVAKALQSGAMVVTGDPEYKKVSKIVEILWAK